MLESFVCGLLAGVLLAMVLVSNVGLIKNYHTAKDECEALLSRDTYCIMFHDDNTSGERFRTKMSSMAQCLKVLEMSKMPMPNNVSGDYEVLGAMWCGGGMERNYNATWWKDKEK